MRSEIQLTTFYYEMGATKTTLNYEMTATVTTITTLIRWELQ